MYLHAASQDEIRSYARRHIEALEMWLRRFIHHELSSVYGEDYVHAERADGSNVMNASIRDRLDSRLASEPGRFSRPIDAATLDVEISLVCNPTLYNDHFAPGLRGAFPDGHAEARTLLSRLLEPRNRLSHANAISVRQLEQVVCYTNDVIDALKTYYRAQGMSQNYNAPMIVRLTDSFGATFEADQIRRNKTGGGIVDRRDDESVELRPGDVLTVEAEIDPTFDPDTYEVDWTYLAVGGNNPTGTRVVIDLDNRHVHTEFSVICIVTSNKDWHRRGTNDDQVSMIYSILPPLE